MKIPKGVYVTILGGRHTWDEIEVVKRCPACGGPLATPERNDDVLQLICAARDIAESDEDFRNLYADEEDTEKVARYHCYHNPKDGVNIHFEEGEADPDEWERFAEHVMSVAAAIDSDVALEKQHQPKGGAR